MTTPTPNTPLTADDWIPHDQSVKGPADGSDGLFDFIMSDGREYIAQKHPLFWHLVAKWRPHVPAPAGEEPSEDLRRDWATYQAIKNKPEAPPQPKGEVEAAVVSAIALLERKSGDYPPSREERTSIAKALASAQAALTASQAREARAVEELQAVSAALGGDARFMDPPDGGDVSIPEQVRRCRAALDEAEAQRDEAVKALERLKARGLEMTRKYGDPNGPDYQQGANDQGCRWVGAVEAELASIKGKTNEQG